MGKKKDEVSELLNEILDHAIANRGCADGGFFRCYTYPHDEKPEWVAKAEKMLVDRKVSRKGIRNGTRVCLEPY